MAAAAVAAAAAAPAEGVLEEGDDLRPWSAERAAVASSSAAMAGEECGVEDVVLLLVSVS